MLFKSSLLKHLYLWRKLFWKGYFFFPLNSTLVKNQLITETWFYFRTSLTYTPYLRANTPLSCLLLLLGSSDISTCKSISFSFPKLLDNSGLLQFHMDCRITLLIFTKVSEDCWGELCYVFIYQNRKSCNNIKSTNPRVVIFLLLRL